MSGTGWVLLIGGGLLAYYLITKSGATYTANPLQGLLPAGGSPQPCGPGLVWGPIPGIVPSWGCVTPQVAAQRGAE